MDIQRLFDEFEAVINKSFRIPFTSNIILNEDELYDLLDQMRISIPQEIKEAKRTEAERQRILAQAKDEAGRLSDIAKEKMITAIDSHEIADLARRRADEIVSSAESNANQLKTDADQYVADHLSDLEEHLLKLLSTVRNGLRHLQETQPVAETTEINPET